MIVADGRTDLEKLRELIQEPEQAALDFKAEVDLSKPRDRLHLVKDLIVLGNNPEGGYLLIGVDDDGKPCLPVGSIVDRRAFDSAKINDLVAKYVEGVQGVITQIHELDGNEIVVVFAEPHADGLPVPTSKLGQYDDAAGPVVVFRPGEVFVREGAKNVTLRHGHWTKLLARHDEAVRHQTRQTIESLLSRLAGSQVPAPVVLLDIDAPADAFSKSVRSAFDSGAKSALARLLDQCRNAIAANDEHSGNALHKVSIIALEAISVGRRKMAARALEAIYQAYLEIPSQPPPALRYLELATYIYVIGGMAARKRAWEIIRTTAVLPSFENCGYRYSSWIRQMQVDSSRAELFAPNDNGLLISAARKLISERPELRPDVVGDLASGDAPLSDRILNSLCQFDFLYCVWVLAEGQDHGGAYPASSAFDGARLKSAFVGFGQAEARRAVFAGLDAIPFS
jgi:hypothetical protein